jgi:hypothetical protein
MDAAGKAHGDRIIESLARIAKDVRRVTKLDGNKDVSELLEAGNDLVTLASYADPVEVERSK